VSNRAAPNGSPRPGLQSRCSSHRSAPRQMRFDGGLVHEELIKGAVQPVVEERVIKLH